MPHSRSSTRTLARPEPAPSPGGLGYSIIPKREAKERLSDAREFLKRGMQEIERGRSTADKTMVREGCEKVFHAFVEAAVARIQKMGLGVPESHKEIRDGLYNSGPSELLKIFDEAFSSLHVLSYYRGWIDYDRIGKAVASVTKGIVLVEKLLR